MRTRAKMPLASVGWCVLLAAGVWALGGCGLFGRREAVVAPPISPQLQMQYAQAESRLSSDDANVREQAAVSLLSMDHPDALPAVLDRMRRAADPAVRSSMIQAAAFLVDHRCFQQILDAAEDPDAKVRDEAAQALARFTQPQEVAAMTARAEAAGPEAQQLIYRALGEGLDVSAVPALLKGLEAGDEGVRTAAWEALERISGRQFPADPQPWAKWWEANAQKSREDILEEHLQALSSRLESRSGELQSLREQQAELMKLVQSPQAETPPQLLSALGSQYDVVRQYAASRLAGLNDEQLKGLRIDDKAVYTVLTEALDDPAEDVRQNVLRFVLRVDGDYKPRLIRKALYDTSAPVLVLAVGAVDSSMGAEVTTRLQDLLAESAFADVREAAANMLGKIGTQTCVPSLMAALDDPAENVRWFAVEGLRKLAAVQAVPRICEMLQKDRSARVREIAASTLGELGQPAGVPALRMALDDTNDRVRQKAVAALLALATEDYERMSVIADAFREKGLSAQAAQVLTNIIKTYRDDPQMKDRVAEAYKALAEVQREQTDYSAAAATYQALDAFMGGSPAARKDILSTWLQAGDPARAAAAVSAWFTAAGPAKDPALIDLGLDAAERLYAAGDQQEGAAVLQLVQQAAGPNPDPEVAARIKKLLPAGTP
jgi:HEAT repeat protein